MSVWSQVSSFFCFRRRDSDFFYPYAEILHQRPYPKRSHAVQFYLKVKNILRRKRYLALALVSNCDKTKGVKERKAYLKKLAKVSFTQICFFASRFQIHLFYQNNPEKNDVTLKKVLNYSYSTSK